MYDYQKEELIEEINSMDRTLENSIGEQRLDDNLYRIMGLWYSFKLLLIEELEKNN